MAQSHIGTNGQKLGRCLGPDQEAEATSALAGPVLALSFGALWRFDNWPPMPFLDP